MQTALTQKVTFATKQTEKYLVSKEIGCENSQTVSPQGLERKKKETTSQKS